MATVKTSPLRIRVESRAYSGPAHLRSPSRMKTFHDGPEIDVLMMKSNINLPIPVSVNLAGVLMVLCSTALDADTNLLVEVAARNRDKVAPTTEEHNTGLQRRGARPREK
ncbi:hypothetical protein BIW11_10487 [Tropilaelaps mercedesae]|uniref:Uncharacterized protein n=1 Tax=Tropilaelaps mercedesae TaxID=418985 RepID=A0A1V9XG02_9ACAR|nr:hypothetical protein BIW11_10487 [Tropilaelaps mercedesae]